MKTAKRNLDSTVRLFEKIGPERLAEIEAEVAEAGLTAKEYADGLIRHYFAEEVKEYTIKMLGDKATAEHLEDINSGTIESFLEQMVEGDEILDDAEVHAFHRRKLDELRAGLAKVEASEPASLSYEAIRSDFVTASKMMDCGLLDKPSQARVAHIRIWGQALTAMEKDLGRVPTQEEADEQLNVARVAVMVGAYDDHEMTVEEIAEAVETTVEDVNACLAFMADKGFRSAKH
jgi:hypothetical protein